MAGKLEIKPAKGKRQLDRVMISKTSDGDFIVEHFFKEPKRGPNEPWEPNQSEPHVFTDGGKMLEHISKTLSCKGEAGSSGHGKGCKCPSCA